jgi:hypothetical protein
MIFAGDRDSARHTRTKKDVKNVHFLLYAKARGDELRRQAERARQRREAREIRRGR